MRAEPVCPAVLEGLDPERRVDLDVREDLSRGQEPLSRIMDAVAALGPGGVLVLRAPFEPLPLYRVRFAQREVWPDYRGGAGDSIDVEIYEHWLEPA